jgi:hypothetical protein
MNRDGAGMASMLRESKQLISDFKSSHSDIDMANRWLKSNNNDVIRTIETQNDLINILIGEHENYPTTIGVIDTIIKNLEYAKTLLNQLDERILVDIVPQFNNAKSGTLEGLARGFISRANLEAETEEQQAVLDQPYVERKHSHHVGMINTPPPPPQAGGGHHETQTNAAANFKKETTQ